MTTFERLIAWAGGAVFVASLALAAWWYGVWLGRAAPFAGWPPLASDATLFLVFAAHHSALARPSMQALVGRVCPARLLRTLYVWTASVLLIAVCLLWQPIGGDVYGTTRAPAYVHAALAAAGVLLIVLSVRAIDPLELAGIRPSHSGLQIAGPYRLVRHPLYLGWMLVVFAPPHMTGDRLLFAIISSAYVLVAIPWEERTLEDTFGEAYVSYRRHVRWRVIPYVY
jgi:protein-S-isoprenylcysteine O-methyltransferase Ste14